MRSLYISLLPNGLVTERRKGEGFKVLQGPERAVSKSVTRCCFISMKKECASFLKDKMIVFPRLFLLETSDTNLGGVEAVIKQNIQLCLRYNRYLTQNWLTGSVKSFAHHLWALSHYLVTQRRKGKTEISFHSSLWSSGAFISALLSSQRVSWRPQSTSAIDGWLLPAGTGSLKTCTSAQSFYLRKVEGCHSGCLFTTHSGGGHRVLICLKQCWTLNHLATVIDQWSFVFFSRS